MTLAHYVKEISDYKIKTFDSQATINYQKAIQYYESKFQILFKNILQQAKQRFLLNADNDLESLFNHVADNFLIDWEQLYNSKTITYEVMKKTINILQEHVERDNQGRAARIDYMLFMNELAKQAGLTNIQFTNNMNLPSFLDLRGLSRIWDKIEKGQNTSIPNLMGEIFEQGITGILQTTLKGLFAQIEQTGSAYSMGKKVKPDALLSLTNFTILNTGVEKGKKVIKNSEILSNNTSYCFEIENLIDLSDSMTNLERLLRESNPGLIGMTAKQWTDQASYKSIAKFKIPQDSLFSKTELDNFKASTLRLYNVWTISRYLISILGSLNVIVASGSKIETTSAFLNSMLIKNKAIIMQKKADLLRSSGSLNIGPRYVLDKS